VIRWHAAKNDNSQESLFEGNGSETANLRISSDLYDRKDFESNLVPEEENKHRKVQHAIVSKGFFRKL